MDFVQAMPKVTEAFLTRTANMRLKEAEETRTLLRLLCPLLLAYLCCSLHKHAQVYVFMCSGDAVRIATLTGAVTAQE